MQNFERYPDLAIWIERLANLGVPGWSMVDWQEFTDALNASLGVPAQRAPNREALKRAFEGGFWAWFGPSNDRELDRGLCELERCWTEYEAEFLVADTSTDARAPISGSESCTCHFLGAGTHHVPGCPFYKIATTLTSTDGGGK